MFDGALLFFFAGWFLQVIEQRQHTRIDRFFIMTALREDFAEADIIDQANGRRNDEPFDNAPDPPVMRGVFWCFQEREEFFAAFLEARDQVLENRSRDLLKKF